MSSFSVPDSKRIPRAGRVPWAIFILIASIFFIAQHDLLFSLLEQSGRSVETITTAVVQGNLKKQVAYVVLGLIGVILLRKRGSHKPQINGLLGFLIVFLLSWTVLSLAWSDYIALTFRRLVGLAMFCICALAISRRFALLDIVLLVFFSTANYLFIGVMAELINGTFLPFASEYRFAGTLHPNSQGINCSLMLLSSASLARTSRRGRKFFIALAIGALAFLILTKSRTAFASTICSLSASWLLVSFSRRRIIWVGAIVWIFCLLFLLLGDMFFAMLREGILLGREDPTTYTLTGRVPLWEELARYSSIHPFIGYGYNSFWTPERIYEISPSVFWRTGSVHSDYLGVLLSLGLIGLVPFVLILIIGIRQTFIYYRLTRNNGFLFLGTLLIFSSLVGMLESVYFNLGFLAFINYVALACLAFQDPYKCKE